MRGTVFVFVKAPIAGRVKTRLGAQIGYGRAAALFRIMTARTLAQCEKGPWRTVLAVDPPGGMNEDFWPPRFARMAQGRGDLGRRMGKVFAEAPPGPALIIGADAPGLRTRHLHAAFLALQGADAVFGPAEDGGYWLIGLARGKPAPRLFDNVRWSSEHALTDTLKTLPEDFAIRMLERLRDVDEAEDLHSLTPYAAAR
ncbi:MAG: TIGR04282 family arsenosugar biosynthesis glycosyltransferase [Pseudomonadota bacterium]